MILIDVNSEDFFVSSRGYKYSLFFDPVYNPSEVTVDCVTYLLFKLEYFLFKTTLSLSAGGCSMLSLDTILFTLIELILLFCWPFWLAAISSTNWPSTDETTVKKRDNKQKSPPERRELTNMIHGRNFFFALFSISTK